MRSDLFQIIYERILNMQRLLFGLCLMFGFSVLALAQEKAIGPDEAAKMVDKTVKMEMKVESAGMDKNKSNMFLNSKSSFKDDGNFTVLVRAGAAEKLKEKYKYNDPIKFFKGKTIQVDGKVGTYNNKPQLVVDGSAQLKVLEENEKK